MNQRIEEYLQDHPDHRLELQFDGNDFVACIWVSQGEHRHLCEGRNARAVLAKLADRLPGRTGKR